MPLAGSLQTPGLGMSGAGEPPLTPIEMAVMLLRTRCGTRLRVVPGTSRSETVCGRATPFSSARSRASWNWTSIISALSAFSYSVLKAAACHVMSPRWIASRMACTSAADGHCSEMLDSTKSRGQCR